MHCEKIIALLTVVGLVVWLLQPLNPLQSSALDKTIDVQHSNCGFELVNSTTAIIRDYLSDEYFIGVTSGIYQQGCGTVLVAAGFRDKLSVLPFEVDTITRIASITKPMTAVAIMQLYEQGLIELDSPLADYLTALPKSHQAIIDNQLISRQTLELMIDARGSLVTLVGDDPYALGWSVNSDAANGTIISHSGAQPGVSAYFQIWLDKKTVAVTLSHAFGTKGSAFAMTNELGQLVVTSQ